MKQNISRRLLPDTVSGAIDQYIQDGLVFHLDGIDKGPTEGAWTDLIAERVLTNGGAAVFESDGVRFTAASGSFLTGTALPNAWTSAHCTIEVCLDGNDSGLVFKSGRAGGVALRMLAASVDSWIASSASSREDFNRDTTLTATTFSLTADQCMQGGHVLEHGTARYLNNGYVTCNIGARRTSSTKTDSYWAGKIFSIRIYDRQLSYKEMLHNQAVDHRRFLSNT